MKRTMLAFIAGAMFLLAGTIEFAMDLATHGPMRLSDFRLGTIFVIAGAMWIAVGAKWKKNAERASSPAVTRE
jgi:uncharacterized membrane protein YidH (DUF202 family)